MVQDTLCNTPMCFVTNCVVYTCRCMARFSMEEECLTPTRMIRRPWSRSSVTNQPCTTHPKVGPEMRRLTVSKILYRSSTTAKRSVIYMYLYMCVCVACIMYVLMVGQFIIINHFINSSTHNNYRSFPWRRKKSIKLTFCQSITH